MRTRLLRCLQLVAIVGMLASCASRAPQTPTAPPVPGSAPDTTTMAPVPGPVAHPKSRWVPVRWADLPGFSEDRLFEAWNALLKSCEKPAPTFAPLCSDVRRLSIATDQ